MQKRMVFAVTMDRAGIMFTGMVSLVLLFRTLLLVTNYLDFSKGQKLEHDPFNADIRDEQTITFGNCGDN